MSAEILRISVCAKDAKRQAHLGELLARAGGLAVLPPLWEQPEIAWVADAVLLDAADAAMLPEEKLLPFCPSVLLVCATETPLDEAARRAWKVPYACVHDSVAGPALAELTRHAALHTRLRLEQFHARADKAHDASRSLLLAEGPALTLESLLFWQKSGQASNGFASVLGKMFQQWSGAARVLILGSRDADAGAPIEIAYASEDADKQGMARNAWSWSRQEPWLDWLQKHQSVLDKASAAIPVFRWMEALKVSYMMPLKSQDRLLGVLAFSERKDRLPYAEKELRLLTDAAWKIGQVLTLMPKATEPRKETPPEAPATDFARKQQMEIIGRMAMRSSHELKNCLVSIRTFTQLFPEKYADEQFRKDFYEVVSKEVERLNGLVEKLLFFAQPVQLKLSQEKIIDLINDALSMFAPEEMKNIQVHRVFGHKQPLLWLDKQQMRAVFYHVIQNSVQALGAGGKFVVITEDHPHADYPEGVLAIRFLDTGRGMSMKDQEEPFEPFFSTKARGMGLGLTIARRIVEEHDGTIRLDSTKDKGTEVIVCLPRRIPPWATDEQHATPNTAETKS